MPDPLGATVDVSVGNVWITGCTTVSIRSGNLVGGTIGSAGVTEGAWAGTESVIEGVAAKGVLIGAYHIYKKIEEKLKCKHRKVIADRLVDLVDESPNLFDELSRARRRDWLNN
ncbi:hypothetical protein H5410_052947 [Solanum commersonii]|uniref:Uncharacterized protein n=1 Tax=Solanum commersonii TaxID=4109 RepID=A0A9J5X5N0_SOLCO|nr:hypothetical protein H5410_052947 [Solanum commersonii]